MGSVEKSKTYIVHQIPSSNPNFFSKSVIRFRGYNMYLHGTVFLLLLVTIALHDANGKPNRQEEGAIAAVGAIVGGEIAAKAVDVGVGELGGLFESYYENDGLICHWNDWKARDQRARIEKTYYNCRFSRAKRTFGITNGRWYCTMKQLACLGKGHKLDG